MPIQRTNTGSSVMIESRRTTTYSWFVMIVLAVLSIGNISQGQDESQPPADAAPANRIGYLVQIPLPIDARVATSVEQALRRLLDQSQNVIRAQDRPTVVLEFETENFKNGRGSQLESCLSLARLLTSADMNRVRTVAYVPPLRRSLERNEGLGDEPQQLAQLMGHAVLVAIAANEMVVAEDATIGHASIDESNLDNLVREVYRSIAEKRLTLPTPVAMSMVDPNMELFRVTTAAGPVYVERDRLEQLEQAGEAIQTITLATGEDTATFRGSDLVRFNLTREQANNRTELARKLKLDPDALDGDPTMGSDWRAVQISMPEYVDDQLVEWSMRALDNHVQTGKANLVILRFNSKNGDVQSCVRLARRLAEMDTSKIRTVAFINDRASGPAGVVALACDHLIMSESAILGGTLEPPIDDERLSDLRDALQPIAEMKQLDLSLMMAMVQPDIEVLRFREIETGQVRLLTLDEQVALPDAANWKLLGPIETISGIKTKQAEKLGITRLVVSEFDQVKTFYQLASDPPSLQPTAADRWLKDVAAYLASPFIAPWLLFGAVFFLSTEMSAPGLGVPGFLGTICLVLFFWSQSLDGNAHWLEILLFITGVIFILLELLVLPGVGIFGIGGFLMVVTSIVLASQTFVIPVNSAQFNRMSLSMLTLAGAGMGFVVAMVALRNVLPHAPFLKRIMLQPPDQESAGLDDHDPEATAHWGHLVNRRGEAITNLAPAGKAKIDGRLYDVITDGRMIEKGHKIRVEDVTGNRIVVSPLEPE